MSLSKLQLETIAIIDDFALIIVDKLLQFGLKVFPLVAKEEAAQDFGAFGDEFDLAHGVIAIGDMPDHVHVDAKFLDIRHEVAEHVAVVLVLFVAFDIIE